MPFMPFQILGVWFRGLLSIAIIVGGVYFLNRWYDRSHVAVVVEPAVRTDDGAERVETVKRVFRFDPGWNEATAFLAGGIVLLAWASVGGIVLRAVATVLGGPRPAKNPEIEDPRPDRTGEVHTITRPDGSVLRVECYGPADAPPIVMTHGWGCTSAAWYYPKTHLVDRFRLIVWDEPGLGLSKKPTNNDYRLENLAADLAAVLELAGGRPAVLVGHSIGGMITLTLCKIMPEVIRTRVAGLVLAHTSYTNPVRTTKNAALLTAIEKPILIPLLHLTKVIWPILWVTNWLSYFNGSAQRSTHKNSFGGTETRGQLDFYTRFMPAARFDVMARGMLGMINYDAATALATIPVPTLVVVGDQDSTTLPEAGRYIQSHIPNARIETLAPAKHMGVFEHHGQFDQLLAGFVESCAAKTAGRAAMTAASANPV